MRGRYFRGKHTNRSFNYRNLRGDQTDETGLGKPRFLITVNRAARGMRQTLKHQIPRLFSNLQQKTLPIKFTPPIYTNFYGVFLRKKNEESGFHERRLFSRRFFTYFIRNFFGT